METFFAFAIVGGPILAALIGIFEDALRVVAQLVWGLVFTKFGLEETDMRAVMLRYLVDETRSLGLRNDDFQADLKKIRSLNQLRVVVSLRLAFSFRMFFYRGAPVLYVPTVHQSSNGAVSGCLIAFNRTVDWRRLSCEAATHADAVYSRSRSDGGGGYYIKRHVGMSPTGNLVKAGDVSPSTPPSSFYTTVMPANYVNWSEDDVGEPRSEKPLQRLAMSPSMKQLVRDVKFWFSHRDWYREREMSWRRGYLLYGRPGTGKTSIIRAIAQELDMPVHIFDLASMSSSDFLRAWEEARRCGSRIVLLEDFDTVFHGRNNVIEHKSFAEQAVSFSTILNTIDGVEDQDGLLLFVTANQVEYIDSAMGAPAADGESSRPGRVDVTVAMDGVDHDGLVQIALKFRIDESTAQRLADASSGLSPAQFQERCKKYALEELWGAST